MVPSRDSCDRGEAAGVLVLRECRAFGESVGDEQQVLTGRDRVFLSLPGGLRGFE